MNTTKAIEKFAPVIPNALVEVIVELSPRSLPTIPPSTISRQHIAKPITVTQNIEVTVRAPANIPPTISIGIHIIVPIQIKATPGHGLFS